ncbi:sperm-associated antigen 16 protein-like protein [Willisornis vidua]|uniref:Sperm-associated antigen 16 protein-like protein n=1 Tax=Willisornis vidua TaxID=1566151 RepID=A0ABQ9CWM3_9PASS|nr:sperm-associated antigen 16 protein-like protein [Willisornis vidua]
MGSQQPRLRSQLRTLREPKCFSGGKYHLKIVIITLKMYLPGIGGFGLDVTITLDLQAILSMENRLGEGDFSQSKETDCKELHFDVGFELGKALDVEVHPAELVTLEQNLLKSDHPYMGWFRVTIVSSGEVTQLSKVTMAPKFSKCDLYKDEDLALKVSADDDFSLQEEDEDLSKALQAIQEQAEDAQILTSQSVLTAEKSVADIPEAMDDFFCNFLVRLGMSRTLDCFQTEWYELIERGVFTVKDAGLVPTVYTHNQQLELENMRLKKDLENYRLAVNKTKEALIKMQKERDFHRMHHKRVVQEKNRLISDMKRLKAHYASYEPVLKQLTAKYEATLKQKMLTSLERDRAVGQVISLQAALEDLESGSAKQNSEAKVPDCTRKKEFEGAPQKALQEARKQKIIFDESSSHDPVKQTEKKMDKRDLKDSEFPVDPEVGTYLECAEEHPQPLKSGEYRLSSLVKVHDFAVIEKHLLQVNFWKITGSSQGNFLSEECESGKNDHEM